MISFFNEILKELPPELPTTINITDYSSSKISIVQVENAFSQPHAFEKYKFLLPFNSEFPVEVIDRKKYHIRKEKIFPLNPGQLHCSETNNEPIIKISPFLALFIEKNFLQDTAKKLMGKDNIFFENRNFDINSNLITLINIFIEESINKQTGYEFIMENLNLQIIVNLLRSIKSNSNYELNIKNYNDNKTINYAIEFMQENYNHDFSLEEVANIINYSPFHFIRLFKAETGKTPFEYLLDIKINRAKHLLKTTERSITDICFSTGFNNRSHFSVVFKKKTGYSPSGFRKIL